MIVLSLWISSLVGVLSLDFHTRVSNTSLDLLIGFTLTSGTAHTLGWNDVTKQITCKVALDVNLESEIDVDPAKYNENLYPSFN